MVSIMLFVLKWTILSNQGFDLVVSSACVVSWRSYYLSGREVSKLSKY